MTPEEFRAALQAPDEDRNTVIVEARVPQLPMAFEKPVPGGVLSLWHAATNPSQAWRIFLPNPDQPAIGPLDSKVPPPVFRWGP
jgi:hypothetical protein